MIDDHFRLMQVTASSLSPPKQIPQGRLVILDTPSTTLHPLVWYANNDCVIIVIAGSVVEWPVVIKSKPLDSEITTMINNMAQLHGSDLAVQYEKHKMETGFRLVKCYRGSVVKY